MHVGLKYLLLIVNSYTTYAMVASLGKEDLRSRTLTEEHARDSFENLLFSVCRFRELTGAYPRNITVSLFYPKFVCPV